MLLLIAGILIVVAIICGIIANFVIDDEVPTVIAWIAGIGAVILLIVCACMWSDVANEHTIDSRIAMYQTENQKIEDEVDAMVKAYMEYENKTFADLSISENENAMTLIQFFPELKSDTMVQSQIGLHTSNAKKIMSLKEEKIELAKTKWLLYFGH